MFTTHSLGLPRIGAARELKRALESHWDARITERELQRVAGDIRLENLERQRELDIVTVGDFSFYDHILDMTMLIGNIPSRFRLDSARSNLATMFAIARGACGVRETVKTGSSIKTRASRTDGVAASEMKKWFDTNYHFIVPELESTPLCPLDPTSLLEQIEEAKRAQKPIKVALPGPVTYLWLARVRGRGDAPSRERALTIQAQVVERYRELIAVVSDAGAAWIQFDEPILVLDYLPEQWKRLFASAWEALHREARRGGVNLLLATYFGDVRENATLLTEIPCDGVHFDLVTDGLESGAELVESLIEGDGQSPIISLGVVNGRNVWRADADRIVDAVAPLATMLKDQLWIAPSCSLLHVPVSLRAERTLPTELIGRLAFAEEKLDEIALLRDRIEIESRRGDSRRHPAATHTRADAAKASVADLDGAGDAALLASSFRSSAEVRRHASKIAQRLPLLPTTTIGSFPQTSELRRARRDFRRGDTDRATYEAAVRDEIRRTIDAQEALGLDVLVHGEPERNDMVEYFAEELAGYNCTQNGWVQSYGSRCVKPPIITGPVSRPSPITVEWFEYAQSLTEKPVKGMLTGPVTMVKWSFAREDIPWLDQVFQVARAIAGEVEDLERAGAAIVQIDEAAFREAQPMKRKDWGRYNEMAAYAFRLTTSRATDLLQIHTHMCYSDFSTILDAVVAMDADVVTIETSRSGMSLLETFDAGGIHAMGPGVYDIHSPLVPDLRTVRERIMKAVEILGPDRVWVNPDCGLKTRTWPEVEASLTNMVRATHDLRARLVPVVAS